MPAAITDNKPFDPLPLGKIANVTPGTLIQLNVNCQSFYGSTFYNTNPGGVNGPGDLWAADVLVSSIAANTGSVYIGYSNMVRATGVGVIMIVKKTDPVQHLAQQVGANKIRIGDLWFDSDNATDGIYAAALAWG